MGGGRGGRGGRRRLIKLSGLSQMLAPGFSIPRRRAGGLSISFS